MSIQSRKQKEIMDRENLILDVALEMLADGGYRGITMNRLAEATDYSKGTIYQHFSCKEEVIIHVAIRSAEHFAELCERVLVLDSEPRQKFVMAAEAYNLHTRLHATEFENLASIKTESLWTKVPEETRNKLQEIEMQVMTSFLQVIDEAISKGDLKLKEGVTGHHVAVAIWSLTHGALTLHSGHQDLQYLGVHDVMDDMYTNIDVYLDGLDWRPLSASITAHQFVSEARNSIFQDVIQQLIVIERGDYKCLKN